MGGGGVKNVKNFVTSFMDDPFGKLVLLTNTGTKFCAIIFYSYYCDKKKLMSKPNNGKISKM
jgi:hypothetical protein